ncbi:DUF3467 domain-containing protein [Gluconobacter roseus]|uniref:DUF3467 domain-containing protein n=1 Tax=Gluconobacter roseus NBRC 3990 TaxID=1307950 RepID=A0A4Y3M3P9_9PROT|nr:DUF3467 domain-containing protein [Gluconobacter roseus]KXV43082.1 hypothetical protein AD943_08845 [Gluconobacter roseus]GBR43294.1 hypothetical protein AA3990_0378 [Gluconobacter roseus NBRC 3990]GEB03912.1 hypothetical protein GRO01_14880 [Gluconobacter roseus NBRC 3990]GLP94365.1 hypothetical protein GCM10007871_23430 [Gluconobacter roseus NBRC 3990]
MTEEEKKKTQLKPGLPTFRSSISLVGVTAHDFMVLFAAAMPQIDAGGYGFSAEATLSQQALITMNPIAAKLFLRDLQRTIDGYEEQFGEIDMSVLRSRT